MIRMRRPTTVGLMLVSLAAAGAGCTRSDDGSQVRETAANPSARPDPDSMPRVIFEPPDGGSAEVAVEVARTPAELQRGLMFRRRMPWDQGMLFLFDREEQQSFWMKNTYLPLDMIFIKSDMSVLGVVENAEPLTLTSRRVPGASQFVVEVNAGWASQHGIVPGTRVRFEEL